jgi:microsomal dipeptidase-like Zn-dependent dipeptidase
MMASGGNLSRLDANGPQADPLSLPLPIIDLHCDLLTYLASVNGADPASRRDIGCSIPFLRSGNVKFQVMAIYSGGGTVSTGSTDSQCDWFRRLATDYEGRCFRVTGAGMVREALRSSGTGIVSAVENASALCDDNDSLDSAFKRLDHITKQTGPVLYISLTHHGENRFGGGNSTGVGLKSDGKVLLDYIADKRIAIDLSHTSDALAHGIINHIDGNGLNIPIIASHSNFRSVYDHRRNLPDELVQVIINRRGLIGMNFLRAFLHPDDSSSLVKHILFGIEIGAKDALCFGADFAYVKGHPDKSRIPFYFKDHEHAGKYGQIVQSLEHILSPGQLEALAFGNGMRFLQRLWSTAS